MVSHTCASHTDTMFLHGYGVRQKALWKIKSTKKGHPDFQSLTIRSKGSITEDFSPMFLQQRTCIAYYFNDGHTKPHTSGATEKPVSPYSPWSLRHRVDLRMTVTSKTMCRCIWNIFILSLELICTILAVVWSWYWQSNSWNVKYLYMLFLTTVSL